MVPGHVQDAQAPLSGEVQVGARAYNGVGIHRQRLLRVRACRPMQTAARGQEKHTQRFPTARVQRFSTAFVYA